MMRARFFNRYSPPGRDSARAIAGAVTHLLNMRSIDHLTIEQFAKMKNLTNAVSARLIAEETQRRARR